MKNQNIYKKYNKKYFNDHDHLDLFEAEAIKILMNDNNLKSVLDVGCGTGRVIEYLSKQGFEVSGCENSKVAIDLARTIHHQKIIKASATKLPFRDDCFDLVIGLSMIEHLSKNDARKFIQESQRVIKPKGFIFLITPNFQSPMRLLLKDKWFGYMDKTHLTFFTPKSISTLLKSNSFTNIRFRVKSPLNIKSDLHLPRFCRKLPKALKNLLSYIKISSFLSTHHDSFWVAAQNNK